MEDYDRYVRQARIVFAGTAVFAVIGLIAIAADARLLAASVFTSVLVAMVLSIVLGR